MTEELVRHAAEDPDHPVWIRSGGVVMRLDVVRAQLIHVQLGKAIAEATASPSGPGRAGDTGRLSVKQRNYILVLCGEVPALKEREARLSYVSGLVGRTVATLNDLTGADAGHVIDALQHRARQTQALDEEASF